MTAKEYFGKVLPTAEDFNCWTRSLFERAQAAQERAAAVLKKEGDADALELFSGKAA